MGDAKGLKKPLGIAAQPLPINGIPPRGLGEDRLVQGQIRHNAFEALVFSRTLFQPFALIAAHATILFVPPVIGLNCYANLPNRLGN